MEEQMQILVSLIPLAIVFLALNKIGFKLIINELKFQLYKNKGAVEVIAIFENGKQERTITTKADKWVWRKDKQTGVEEITELVQPYTRNTEKGIPQFIVIEGQKVNWNPYVKSQIDQSNKRANYATAEMLQIGRLQATSEFLEKIGKHDKIMFYAIIFAAGFSIINVVLAIQMNDVISRLAAAQGIAVNSKGILGMLGLGM